MMPQKRFSQTSGLLQNGGVGSVVERWIRSVHSNRHVRDLSFVALFVLTFAIASLGLLRYGKGFIWVDDGLEQQYTYFVFEGQWLRELFANIFVRHELAVPMWSNSLGYGADAFVCVSNTLGNPINLLSVFAIPQNADWWLNATVPLTLFLAGRTFLRYCDYKGFDSFYSIVGALTYIFSAYTIVMFEQIYLLYPLVLGPCVLLGADKVFDGQTPLTLAVSLCLTALNSVFVAYVTCLLLLVYCLVRYCYLDEHKTPLSLLKWAGRFLLPVVLGIAMAAVLFLPIAHSILSQNRLNLDRPNNLLYPLTYYGGLYIGFLGASRVGSECLFGIGGAGLCALLALPGSGAGRRSKVVFTLFITFFILLCLPVAGRISNGMAYASNRWVWAISLVAGVAVAEALPQLETAERRKKLRVVALGCAYAVAGIALLLCARRSPDVFAKSALAFFLLTTAFLAPRPTVTKVLCCMLVVIGTGTLFIPWAKGVQTAHVALGGSYEAIGGMDPGTRLVAEQTDSDAWRYEDAPSGKRNAGMATGLLAMSYYNSYYNSSIDAYHTSLGLTSSPFNFSYNGLDSRCVLDAFAGVKYYLARGVTTHLPAQFDHVAATTTEEDRTPVTLYVTDHTLPTAFLTEAAIPRVSYDTMSMVERQDALTRSVVLEEDETTSTLGNDAETSNVSDLSFEIVGWSIDGSTASMDSKGASFVSTSATITQPNTTVYLATDLPEGAESYVNLVNLGFADPKRPTQGLWSSLKQTLWQNGPTTSRDIYLSVTIDGDGTKLWQPTRVNDLYGGKDDWCIHLPNRSGHVTVAVTFDAAGTYTFDRLSIESMGTQEMLDNIDALATTPVSNQAWKSNGFSCTAKVGNTASQTDDTDVSVADEYLVMRIPYDTGWSATVDGQDTDLLKADLGFMALKLSPGTHLIELHYATPLLGIGALVSVAAWAVFGGWALLNRRRRARTAGAK